MLSAVFRDVCLLDCTRPVLVGVSGGADSVFLLEAFIHAGYPVIVAHLDHGLRPEAPLEARFVQQLAETHHLTFVTRRVDTGTYAEEHALTTEEAARLLRYRFLFQQATLHKAQAVAVGHTADDQVETILLHLVRGSGLSGLRGMAYRSLPNAWSEDIPLVRPLLGLWREQILAELQREQIAFVQDASNLDVQYFRNRIRQELIPLLRTYNPAIKKLLWQMAEVLQEDYALLEAMTEAAWKDCLEIEGEGYLCLSKASFRSQPLSLQRRLIRRAVHRLQNRVQDMDYAMTARALRLIAEGKSGKRVDLTACTTLELEGKYIWVKTWKANLPDQEYPQLESHTLRQLSVPGELTLGRGWHLSAQVLASAEVFQQAFTNSNPFQAFLNLDAVQTPLLLRPRRPGDHLAPLGMGGRHIKLSDLMINHKIPRRARDRWPVILSGEEIVWVPGCQISHTARVKKGTKQIVLLTLQRGTPANSR